MWRADIAQTGDFGEKATRPAYSALENKALQAIGLDRMCPWQDAFAAHLKERRQTLEKAS